MGVYLLLIDDNLRIILQQLEVHLAIKLDEPAVNKVFADEEQGLITAKFCTLFKQPQGLFANWLIEGIVDEHEPETIWIQSRGGLSKQHAFDSFFKELTRP